MELKKCLERLQSSLADKVILPDSPLFRESFHIWNHRLQATPAAVVQCLNAEDVATAVKLARQSEMSIAVKGGGHSYAGLGTCRDGLLLDLSSMKAIQIDPQKKRARVGPGVIWSEFNEASMVHGLATPGATVSTVGVAGFTLGGGGGYLSRLHGLAVDNLVSAELITAEGERITASESVNPDLFWAIRGGGGNFGIVTEFELKLHEIPTDMLAGQIMYPFKDAGVVLRAYRDLMTHAPDGFTCFPCLFHVPPIPDFPEELHGEVVIDLVIGFVGNPDEGQKVVSALRGLGQPILDLVGPQPYTEVQKVLDPGVPEGQRWYSRSHYMDELSDEAIDTFLAGTESLPGPLTLAYFDPMGGAIQKVHPTATAFPHRKAAHNLHILAGWTSPDEDAAIMEWVRKWHKAMAPYATGGVYVNLLGEDEQDRVRKAYGENWKALKEIKQKWDPGNFFRRNQNIR